MNYGQARLAVGLCLYLDHQQRRANYEEWRERMEKNISRWEDALSSLENARSRIQNNLENNQERLEKNEGFLDRITSEKTVQWYERCLKNIEIYKTGERVEEMKAKVAKYQKDLATARATRRDIKRWIQEGEDSLGEIDEKISDLRHKIRDVSGKLN